MACFSPRYGFRAERGLIRLSPVGTPYWRSPIVVSCGQCIGCRAEQKRQWAVRGMHELSLTRDLAPNYVHGTTTKASFITLTYSDEKLPENGQLTPRDWTLFAKKLRNQVGPFRFLMCGEYGDAIAHTNRCHFHAILFGQDFHDSRTLFSTNKQGHKLFTSPELGKAWKHGHHAIGDVSFDSVAYVAGYIQKKVNGRNKKNHYSRTNAHTGEVFDQVPEFGRMSRNPGLGHDWIQKYHSEVYPSDSVVINGQLSSPPDYYDRWYEKHYPEKMEAVKAKRKTNARFQIEDNSPDRLAVKRKIFVAKHRK